MAAKAAPMAASPPGASNGQANSHAVPRNSKPQLPNWDELNACSSPGNAVHMLQQRKKKRKDESLVAALCAWIVQHQIGVAVNFLILLSLTHAFLPRARPVTTAFFQLSYHDAATGKYGRGPEDFYFITFWIFAFTGIREAVMSYMLLPLAQQQGISSRKKRVRFAEQAWLLLYYTVFWSLGMYIIYQKPYFNDLSRLWSDFPEVKIDGPFKWYYLVQFGFWIQQIVVVNIEERRKDYTQMFTHHIVTCMLILCSYGYYQHKAGNVILVLMDLSDITLPLAKLLKYAGYQTACDVAFGVFILSWLVSRHLGYLAVCWSIWADVPNTMTFGCYSSDTGETVSPSTLATVPAAQREGIISNIMQPYTNPGEPVCFNPRMRWAFLALLFMLQCILIMWFTMILRVAYRVLSGKGADDSRSDDEDEDEDTEELEADDIYFRDNEGVKASLQELKPLELEVGVEGLNLKNRTGSSSGARLRRGGGARSEARTGANGLSVAGPSGLGDRKELLGRIGCDKPS